MSLDIFDTEDFSWLSSSETDESRMPYIGHEEVVHSDVTNSAQFSTSPSSNYVPSLDEISFTFSPQLTGTSGSEGDSGCYDTDVLPFSLEGMEHVDVNHLDLDLDFLQDILCSPSDELQEPPTNDSSVPCIPSPVIKTLPVMDSKQVKFVQIKSIAAPAYKPTAPLPLSSQIVVPAQPPKVTTVTIIPRNVNKRKPCLIPRAVTPYDTIHEFEPSVMNPNKYSDARMEMEEEEGAINNEDLITGLPGDPVVLSEEEKRLLQQEGVQVFPTHLPLSRSQESLLRRVRRKIRNKKSAKLSRAKKQRFVDHLQIRALTCSEENANLKQQICHLHEEKRGLLEQVRQLREKLAQFARQSSSSLSTANKVDSSTKHFCIFFLFALLLAVSPSFLSSMGPVHGPVSKFVSLPSASHLLAEDTKPTIPSAAPFSWKSRSLLQMESKPQDAPPPNPPQIHAAQESTAVSHNVENATSLGGKMAMEPVPMAETALVLTHVKTSPPVV